MLFRLFRFKESCAVHALVILVAFGTGCATQRSFKLKRHTEEQAEFGEYAVRVLRNGIAGGRIEISQGDAVVWAKANKDGGFYIGGELDEADEGGRKMYLPIGSEITSEGKPNLVITEWTEYPTTSYTDYIFELGERLRPIGVIQSGTNPLLYKDLDGDGALEAALLTPFGNEEFSGSALASVREIVFRYTNRVYQPILRRSGQADLGSEALKRLAEKLRRGSRMLRDTHAVASDLHNAMIALIYSKNEALAEQLLDLVWLNDEKSKKRYWNRLAVSCRTDRLLSSVQPATGAAPR